MHKEKIEYSLLLLLTAAIWGVSFVAQSVGMDYIGPFTFNAVRSLMGAAVLIPGIWILGKMGFSTGFAGEKSREEKMLLLRGGISCGVLLTIAANFQQFGIKYTSVGRTGFITAFYIVIVPFMEVTFFGKKSRAGVWASVALALAGLYLLCITGDFGIGKGDFYVLICSFFFSLHVLVIAHYSPMVDGVKMSCIQFLVCGVLSGAAALLTEQPQPGLIAAAWQPLIYAGVLSCGVAYTLQIIGQKKVEPAAAALILSAESCISVLAGWVILGQKLTLREAAGCALMFAAIILAQLPEKKKDER